MSPWLISGNLTADRLWICDGNDNLSKVTQTGDGGSQEFRYDCAFAFDSRKTSWSHATPDVNGVKGAVDANNKWTKVLKYDSHSYCARASCAEGETTYDGLNRVETVIIPDGIASVTLHLWSARASYQTLTRVEICCGWRDALNQLRSLIKIRWVGETPANNRQCNVSSRIWL